MKFEGSVLAKKINTFLTERVLTPYKLLTNPLHTSGDRFFSVNNSRLDSEVLIAQYSSNILAITHEAVKLIDGHEYEDSEFIAQNLTKIKTIARNHFKAISAKVGFCKELIELAKLIDAFEKNQRDFGNYIITPSEFIVIKASDKMEDFVFKVSDKMKDSASDAALGLKIPYHEDKGFTLEPKVENPIETYRYMQLNIG